MAILWSILALLAIVAAIGSASSAQRKRAGRLTCSPQKMLPPSSAASGRSLKQNSTQPSKSEQAVQPIAASAPPATGSLDPVVEELAESLSELLPNIPLAASLTVSEVVNPQENELGGVQLDRVNLPQDASALHHRQTLLQEIAALAPGQGDRVARLAELVEHPDRLMRVTVADTLGELAVRSQGQEQEVVALLVRLSQDVDLQVRTQAAAALGAIESPNSTL